MLEKNPDLKEKLSQLPLWRHARNEPVIYLSEGVLRKLPEANVTGLNPYTTYDGKPGESLARFE